MELQTLGHRITKTFGKSFSQAFQFRLKPIGLALKYGDAGWDEMLITRVSDGAGSVQVKQMHNEKDGRARSMS